MFGANAWRVGRIGGIDIRIDPSWSIIAFLIAYSFYFVLDFQFPAAGQGTLILLSAAMAALFFGSVLLHELAHSWVAVARGVEVHGITLFLFGGATHADLDTESPEDELAISIVGPITSLALAGVFWLVAGMTGTGAWEFGLNRLAFINLLLAGFNLVPGFPLDGGRILRALIWRSRGDVVAATRTAARAGQITGYALMGLGILELVLLGSLIGGLWFMAIGWFLAQSAQAAFLRLQVTRLLADVPASQLMTTDLIDIPAELTIHEAVDRYFMRYDHSAFPVRDFDRVSGLVTLSSIKAIPREDWSTRTVSDATIPLSEACTAQPSEPMDEVLDKLTSNEARRVVIVDDGSIAGIITAQDLTRYLQRTNELGLTGLNTSRF
jgi:Zn-dependent protease/predicted transcriptional regulator